MIPNDYVLRVYAGWLGKVIGVRHGGNVEGWTYERLREKYGEITGYLHEFKNFAADDDTNGPMVFLRSLEDYTYTRDITAEQMGLGLLNYAPDGHGFFWWGGYGNSTEHTAYLNLKNGIMAPRSGSSEQNGSAVAEQIGGQIFIDVWGLIAPGDPDLAAEYAGKMASVTHDGNGKYGGMFIAACIAKAFVEQDVEQIIAAGLSVIPSDSEYTRMARAVMGFAKDHPNNWRDCFQFVHDNFGYDRYPGVCHVIPNSAVIILSLLYSGGDFSRAINVCNMCGWDTDCNVANVGTIMGVRNGLDGIDPSWRIPINDFLCCSTVLGSLNIVDLPNCASTIARLGYLVMGAEIPKQWENVLTKKAPRLHFEYPGSTHAIRTVGDGLIIENSEEAQFSGNRSLKVTIPQLDVDRPARMYYQTYYRPADFNDSRYDPSFSPILYPGQTIRAAVMCPDSLDGAVQLRLYVRDGHSGTYYYGDTHSCIAGNWESLQYHIPAMANVCIQEVGIECASTESLYQPLVVYVDHIDFEGLPDYSVDFSHERHEVWHGLHIEVSQLTYLRGLWRLENGELSGSYYGEPAEAYTGHLDWSDYVYEAEVVPQLGNDHRIQFRVQGGIRSYAVGLGQNATLNLYKNDNGYQTLASVPFSWEHHSVYRISVEAHGNHYTVSVDDRVMLSYTDNTNPYLYGQVGFSNANGSHTHYRAFSVRGR